MHPFEKAGLGKAPFSCFGQYESIYQALPDAPKQPGTSCDYCGTGIMDVFMIRSSDNRQFKVGCDCVAKTSEKNDPLAKQVKKAITKLRAERSKKRWADRVTEAKDFLAANPDAFIGLPNPYVSQAERGKSLRDYLTFFLTLGTTNQKKAVKLLEEKKAEADARDEAFLGAAQEVVAKEASFEDDNKDLLARMKDKIAFDRNHRHPLSNEEDQTFIEDIYKKALATKRISDGQRDAVLAALDRHDLRLKSRHVGKVGQRLDLRVVVEHVSSYERPQAVASWLTEWVFITTMRDQDGNCFVAKTTSFKGKVDAEIAIRATVKEHSTYGGREQTVVQRIKVLEAA